MAYRIADIATQHPTASTTPPAPSSLPKEPAGTRHPASNGWTRSDIVEFARYRPATFLAGGVLAGFALTAVMRPLLSRSRARR